MREEEIIDIIPIKLNEKIPPKEEYYHIAYISSQYDLASLVYRINMDIKDRDKYDYLILLKEGKVITILWVKKK